MELSVTVVIPTFQRPPWLRQAVASILRQDHPVERIIIIVRDTDAESLTTARDLAKMAAIPIDISSVTEPGFIPPIEKAFGLIQTDVAIVLDDDAEAPESFVSRLLRHYEDPTVGGVGGRCVNMNAGQPVPVATVARVGYLSFWGYPIGDMYKAPGFAEARAVSFLLGGCCSYRREVTQSVKFDGRLNQGVAFGYEVDIGLQVLSKGWKLLFEPEAWVYHYSAPRALAGMRVRDDRTSVSSYAYNQMLIAARRYPRLLLVKFVLYSVIVGERRAPGILMALVPFGRELGIARKAFLPVLRARARAIRDVYRESDMVVS